MIEKPTIVITSLGRTGTEFFTKLFAEIIPDCTSLHEPDIYGFMGVENKIERYSQQIRLAGIWRMVFLKFLGRWTLVKLSDARFYDTLSYHHAIKDLHSQRNGFIRNMRGSIYIESNLGYYGLLDVMPAVFMDHRVIYIIRDGRDWIRSHLNWGELYGKTGIRKLFAHKWPTAKDVPEDALAEKWDYLSKFDQLCWTWTKLNEFALNNLPKNPHARLFYFEKIFTGEEKYQYLQELVSFVTSRPSLDSLHIGSTRGWLERKIHQSPNDFPSWENWTKDQKRQFEHLCGPLMEKLGYKF